jgi:predicted N-acetyltransferase YhbS
MTWSIRVAQSDDRAEILGVVRAAFSDDNRDGQEEIDIVLDTWSLDSMPRVLELVAMEGGVVTGHVLASRGDLNGREVLAVAPLAVAPSQQREGIGSALMSNLLCRADEAGWPLVVLLGWPAYYQRFGFEAAGPLGITYPAVGAHDPRFLVRRLTTYDPSYRGEFRYCWEHRPTHRHDAGPDDAHT